MSVVFAAGSAAKKSIIDKITSIYGNINMDTFNKVINTTAHTPLHVDERDIGIGGKHLSSDPYIKSGMKFLGNDKKVLQFVTVISYRNYENDALFGISERNKNASFTLKCPNFDVTKETEDSLRITTYAMDFSETHHGNIVYSEELPQDVWTLRITSYATNHAATWNEWLKKNQNEESKTVLNKMIGNIKK